MPFKNNPLCRTNAVASTIAVFYGLVAVSGHTRLECPPPRSAETGAKVGPCDAPDDLSLSPYPLHPGLNTITWLESLGHPGAPARFALSLEGVDDGFESCILLDHVPHDEQSNPTFEEPLTYHRSSITLFLPDVYCERCHLQLITFMTDEIHGVPPGQECAYKGAQEAGTVDKDILDCKVVYHSCAPISIDGTIPRDQYQCSRETFEKELGWPFMENQRASSIYLYKGNPGMYDKDAATLVSEGSPVENCYNFFYCDPEQFYQMTYMVPEDAKYIEPHGTCAGMTSMKVEPFVLGKLPSVPKVGLSTGSESSEDELNGIGEDVAESTDKEDVSTETSGNESISEEDVLTQSNAEEGKTGNVGSSSTSTSSSFKEEFSIKTFSIALMVTMYTLLWI